MEKTTPRWNPRIVARNIIREHGLRGFRVLIDLFKKGESGEKIGYAFGVTRQRVHQWRTTLGQDRHDYILNPDLLEYVVEDDEASRGDSGGNGV